MSTANPETHPLSMEGNTPPSGSDESSVVEHLLNGRGNQNVRTVFPVLLTFIGGTGAKVGRRFTRIIAVILQLNGIR